MKNCTWNGKEYPSISSAARANNNISPAAMRLRLNAGYTCDDDMVGQGYNWMRRRLDKGYACDSDMKKSLHLNIICLQMTYSRSKGQKNAV